MTEFFILLYKTVLLRPYVFIFFAVFAISAILDLGLKRAICWTVLGYLIAFACEFSSIHLGFPFGDYYYIQSTLGKELWIFGVPFMDSLSFVFLSYISFRFALFFTAPLIVSKKGIFVAETKKLQRLPQTIILTGLLMMIIDLITDPVTLLGEKWFLGQTYGYPEIGTYFGVPFANFAGWFFVGTVIPMAYLICDHCLNKWQVKEMWQKKIHFSSLLPVGLYFGIVIFMLSVTIYIKEYLIFWASFYIHLPLLFFFIIQLTKKNNRATAAEIEAHNKDFPNVNLSI